MKTGTQSALDEFAERETDTKMLKELLESEKLNEDQETAFGDMLNAIEVEKYGPRTRLTEKQRDWVKGVYDRLELGDESLNLASNNLVPRGRPVMTPEVLKRLPMRPPGRK